MDAVVLAVFAAVYLGMMLGRVPGLRIDRTGIALLGAVVLLATGRMGIEGAWRAVDASTIALLVGLMVVSAQLRLGGFYTAVTDRVVGATASPERLLGQLVLVAGALAALLANDVVCLAMTPIVVEACARRRLDPVPFVLALAAAANVGSAATLIGNPQNMLIAQALDVSFARYLVFGIPPAVAGLWLTWWLACRTWRGRFERAPDPVPVSVPRVPFDRWQTGKGLGVLAIAVGAFVFAPVPRDVVALGAAATLLLSRRLHTREMLGLVDWQLCVLFGGLFVVHAAFAATGAPERAVGALAARGIDPEQPSWLFASVVVLSNLVSNVPAVMLLLPVATDPLAAPVLALASTLAGNLVLVGSIANLIVVDQATRLGVRPQRRGWFAEHVRYGLPLTIGTLTIAAAWLALCDALGG